jgi:hypothetical protein
LAHSHYPIPWLALKYDTSLGGVLDAAWIKAQLLCGDKTRDRSIIRASMARGIIEAIESGATDADSLVRAALSELHRADE